MSDAYVKNVVEAALLAAGTPVALADLARLFEERSRPGTAELRAALEELVSEYAGRGIELKETASGYRVQVRRELAPEISRLWPERAARYSRALLETLALIAYRQPITRADIEEIRGVSAGSILKSLLERGLVDVVGKAEALGRPLLYGTTPTFLELFSLRHLGELPRADELAVALRPAPEP